MSQQSEEEVELSPLPVTVVNPETSKAPEFGVWSTFPLLGTEPAQRLLPQDNKRSRAVIQVNPGAAGNNLGFVLVGSRSQVQNGQGGQLVSGNRITYESSQEVWIVGDGSKSLYVTMLEERYA